MLFAGALAENDNSDELLPVFASDHLAWMGRFLEKVAAGTRLPFYRVLADSTLVLLRELV